MGLHDITPGLGDPTRRLIQNGKSAVKVTLSVASGDELVVSEGVAEQLVASSASFQDATPGKREVWDGIVADAVAAAEPEAAPVDPEPKAKPAKKAAAKKAAVS